MKITKKGLVARTGEQVLLVPITAKQITRFHRDLDKLKSDTDSSHGKGVEDARIVFQSWLQNRIKNS